MSAAAQQNVLSFCPRLNAEEIKWHEEEGRGRATL